jgi:prepilin-type N-terminal cleavage/methylation domain-containing protein
MPRFLKNKAFSLIELVVVIVIIGIIAAIAVPRMSKGAEQSRAKMLRANVLAFQRAVDLYTAEHENVSPAHDTAGDVNKDPVAFMDRLLMNTLVNGAVDKNGSLGPYLKEMPLNPFSPTQTIHINPGDAPTNLAFRFDPETLTIHPDNEDWPGTSLFFYDGTK